MDRYRNNPFHVLGLRAGAATREIFRARDLHLRSAEIGGAAPTRPALPFLPQPARDRQAIEAAARELEDPVKRLRHELYWPGDGERCAALPPLLQLLGAQDYAAFFRQAEDCSRQPGPTGVLARHLLAVVSHALAIEGSRDALGSELKPFVDWHATFMRWRAVAEDDGFWSMLHQRASQIHDPRLQSSTVAALQNGLIPDLLHANLEVGLQPDSDGRLSRPVPQVEILSAAPFPPATKKPALQSLYSALETPFYAEVAAAGAKLAHDAIAEQPNGFLNSYLHAIEADINSGPLPTARLLSQGDTSVPIVASMIELFARLLRTLSLAWNNDAGAPTDALRVNQLAQALELSPAWREIFEKDRADLEKLAAKMPAPASKPTKAPSLRTVNGIGTTIYGKRDVNQEARTYIATRWFTVFFLPVLALGAYRVQPAGDRSWYFLSREPLGRLAKNWNRAICGICALLIIFAVASGAHQTPDQATGTASLGGADSTATASSQAQSNQNIDLSAGLVPTPPSATASTQARTDPWSVVATSPAPTITKQQLSDWIDSESSRLKTEQSEIETQRQQLDADRTLLDANPQPTQADFDAFNARIDAFNRKLEQWKADVHHLNSEIDRYNNMP